MDKKKNAVKRKEQVKPELKEAKKEKKLEKPKKKEKYGGLFTSILPMNKDDKEKLVLVQEILEFDELKILKYLLKTHKARFEQSDFDTSHGFLQDSRYLSLVCNVVDEGIKRKIGEINKKIVNHEKEKVFEAFSHNAEEKILGLIAPNIIGMNDVKKAGLVQLFAKEKAHILLLGDPATGKTDILRSISDLAPVSSFGLGSGASKAGLTLVVQGKEVIKGLLPQADKGVACIDELNLLRNIDRAGLLNAMEKGFVTYDKGNTHLKLDANVNVFATANPSGDRFVGRTVAVLKKQVPFDSALLSRFHLVFLIRKPDTKQFLAITDKIVKGVEKKVNENDMQFVKQYVAYALKQPSEFDKNLSSLIQGFIEDVKKDEDQFIIEISPRIVIGVMNMAKAAARMRLKPKVQREDIIKVLKMFNSALYVKKE